MTKMMIEVYLPASMQSFDIQIPADMMLSAATPLIADAVAQLSNSIYSADSGSILCDRSSGDILNINMTVWDLGLRNGSRVMLI